jgi:hypothetical protein
MIDIRTDDLSDDPHRLCEFAGLTSFGYAALLPLSPLNGPAATVSKPPGPVGNDETPGPIR